jgi:hypothetical protein
MSVGILEGQAISWIDCSLGLRRVAIQIAPAYMGSAGILIRSNNRASDDTRQ